MLDLRLEPHLVLERRPRSHFLAILHFLYAIKFVWVATAHQSQTKLMLDASAGGSISRKTEDEAYDLIELMADNEEAHDTHVDAIQELSMIQNNVIT